MVYSSFMQTAQSSHVQEGSSQAETLTRLRSPSATNDRPLPQKPHISFLSSLINKLSNAIVFTPRGALLALAAAYLLLGPARNQSDILATTLGLGLALLLSISALITVVVAIYIRRSTSASLKSMTDDSLAVAGVEVPLAIELNAPAVPPFFRLSLKLHFEHPFKGQVTHHVHGRGRQGDPRRRTLIESTPFPHRGAWRTHSLSTQFGDRFGLTRNTWEMPLGGASQKSTTADSAPLGQVIRIRPHPYLTEKLPIITSAHRPGDLLSEIREPQGDLFDLKRYAPGDSMRRIAWKIYARSGELISRHPEPSISPDGQVVAFVLATPMDDDLASTVIEFARAIELNDLQPIIGCIGYPQPGMAVSSSETERVLIENAWGIETIAAYKLSITDNFKQFVERTRRALGTSELQRISLFFSAAQFNSTENMEQIVELVEVAAQSGIEPIIYVIGLSRLERLARARPANPIGRVNARLAALLTDSGDSDTLMSPLVIERQSKYFFSLLDYCASKRWQVVKVA